MGSIAISRFAAGIEPSATQAAGAKAREMKAAGIEVFDFSLGEPDFDTPAHICEAAFRAMKEGHTHYTAVAGIPALRAAIADHHRNYHGLNYSPDQVIVSSGARQSIFTALSVLLDPGDEVLLIAPYWTSYRDMIQMQGGVPVIVETNGETAYKATGEQIRSACTPNTKLLIINSPCNPTGSTYTRKELEAIAEVVLEKDILVLSDDIYDRIVYDDTQFLSIASLAPELYDRTLTVNGASKSYAMTGWRMGWTAGPREIIKAMEAVQAQETSNPSSVSQHATLAALLGDQSCVESMRAEFARRREFVCKRVATIPGVELVQPSGAFYAFLNVSQYFGRRFGRTNVEDSMSFCMTCLEQAKVNLVAGRPFGGEGHARMSFATSLPTIERGLDALERWLKSAE